jgi:hypothetical protein
MKVTVKTLDAGSQDFELPAEVREVGLGCDDNPLNCFPLQTKVGGLKQQILEKMVGYCSFCL